MDYNYEESIGRNIGLLTPEEQEIIRNTTISIVGVGGVGSWAAVMVAKTGFGHIIVVDKDEYELPNMVEQLFAKTDTFGKTKAEVAKQEAAKHGPFANIKAVVKDIQSVDDAKAVCQGADYIICGVDDAVARVQMDRASRELRIPIIMAANIGWRITVSTHTPDGISYEEHTHQPSLGKELSPQIAESLHLQQKVYIASIAGFTPAYVEKFFRGEVSYISYLAVPAAFAASAAVNEVLKLITGKGKTNISPNGLTFDMLNMGHLDPKEIGMRTYRIMQAVMGKGIEEGIKTWKETRGET
jgi:molybdopterin/thiamine biosynthesis adenylyltransferase